MVIPSLAKGFKECGKYMTQETKQDFLDKFVSARIGIRGSSVLLTVVIAEHYLALQNPRAGWIGVVNTKSSPIQILESICKYVQTLCELNYGSYPDYQITGYTKTTFAYINVHMEVSGRLGADARYPPASHSSIFLWNSSKTPCGPPVGCLATNAVVEESERLGRYDHPPIEICIGNPRDDVVIRFRDQGGGIKLADQPRVWEYSFTTYCAAAADARVEKDDDFMSSRMSMQQSTGGPIAGLGFGLPMSRVYAKYFGGDLEFRSVSGHGTDVFLSFPSLTSDSFASIKVKD
ncbi:hypothetical protein HDU91_007200 [Kappamyces sp. JEL0680]|nr:hypothetical protein HDU91_007200 [Kappamyces sp. JEL0680]